MNNDFPRIKRLPPYVFNITNELKMAARHRGEDIIDLSMGNPDGDTPKHIVDKMVEVAQRPGTHGYSASRGIPRLRKAISDWYKRRWDVDIDPDKEAIVTIGSKEGIAHLMLAVGLLGKPRIMSLGLGVVSVTALSNSLKKSMPGPMRTLRTSAPAMMEP